MEKENKKNTKESKPKEKRKPKKKIVVLLGIILVLLIVGISYLFYNKYIISSGYSKNMLVKTDATIYKKEKNKYIKIGTIYKDSRVSLTGIEGKYYKLNQKNYYIQYKDLKKIKKQKSDDTFNSVLFNQNVITKKNIIIYKNKKKYLKINKEMELPILEKNEEYYICLYNNELLEIKKKDVKKIKEAVNNKEEIISSIPVLYFSTSKNIEEKLKVLSDNKYKFITKEEYIKWQKDNIAFAKNTTFIIFQEEFEDIKDIVKKYHINYTLEKDVDLKFVENDAFSEKDKLYWYSINEFIDINRFKDILNGVKLDESEYATRIAVLNYHFFSKEGAACNEVICLDDKKFEEQLKYLKDNNYKSLTMEEYNKWLKGEIELPKKSVLLTVDDGALGTDTVLPDMLDKYNQKATLFLITSFWPMSKHRTGNLEIQSHSHSLHDREFCYNGNCGIKTLVWTKEEILKDIRKSKEIIGGNPIAYCYPFYEHDAKTREAVKEEFELAFVGGNRKSTRKDDSYLIPRYVIWDEITLNDFIEMIS